MEKRENKSYTLRFAAANRDMFEYIRNGKKRVETRAATVKYQSIKAGDTLIMNCQGKKFSKIVTRVRHFKTLASMYRIYTPSQINPNTTTTGALTAIYHSFPGYEEKLRQFGILAFELG